MNENEAKLVSAILETCLVELAEMRQQMAGMDTALQSLESELQFITGTTDAR